MFQKKIDDYANKYMMLTNADRRLELLSVKRRESFVANAQFFVLLATLLLVGIAGWTGFMAGGYGASAGNIEIEHIFFPIVIFVEVALARTTTSTLPLVILLVTSLLATVVTFGLFFYYILYAIVFIPFEMRMIAMKIVPGYPMFADVNTDSLGKNITYEQMVALKRKMLSDNDDPEGARARDSEKLDKILSGEMDLDEFLGVEKIDTRNVRMDKALEESDFFEARQFADKYTAESSIDVSAAQPVSDDGKLTSDVRYPEQARELGHRNLDKILSGELDFGEFLGVKRPDIASSGRTKINDVDNSSENDPDDSAESYFSRFTRSGGRIQEKASDDAGWLDGGDANSAESYFRKFEKRGGSLDEEGKYKPNISFDRVIDKTSDGGDNG